MKAKNNLEKRTVETEEKVNELEKRKNEDFPDDAENDKGQYIPEKLQEKKDDEKEDSKSEKEEAIVLDNDHKSVHQGELHQKNGDAGKTEDPEDFDKGKKESIPEKLQGKNDDEKEDRKTEKEEAIVVLDGDHKSDGDAGKAEDPEDFDKGKKQVIQEKLQEKKDDEKEMKAPEESQKIVTLESKENKTDVIDVESETLDVEFEKFVNAEFDKEEAQVRETPTALVPISLPPTFGNAMKSAMSEP